MNFTGIRFKIMSIFAILLISGTVSFSDVYALEIRVKERAVVQGDMIRLGEIASFNPANDSRVARLSRIEISSAPSPGNSFRLNERLLIHKIGSVVADDNNIRVKVPDTLFVRRSAQFISATQLEEIFREHVMEYSPWPAERIECDRIRTPGSIALPEGKLHWEVRGKGNRHYSGNIALAIDFWVDGKQVRKVPVSGRISVSQELVKAARKIRSGQLITKDDLILVTESNVRHNKYAVTRLIEAIGKRSVRSIQDGQLITSRMIEDPPLIKKGSSVLIKAENELIRITTRGKILEDGRTGDQVKVINISSGKEIFATVKGPGLVEVIF
ncbi:MAG: flagellar basal body P-ring formation protein FlgA [Deltaproteobacteria bacterium]|nr:flagellar basal body P-ring formation protein FlgA [Deltaproteobacteria bacterium]